MRSRFFSSTTRHLGVATTTTMHQKQQQHYAPALAVAAGAVGAIYMISETNAQAKALPIYKRDEIAKHNTEESLWVHYEGKVYDVTEFAQSHPGGKANIMLAAGGDLAPFWNIYRQHQTAMVAEIISQYQIGVLDPADVTKSKTVELDSPYGNEPERHPSFKINKEQPFNGEPPPTLLKQSFITPNELHFIRNRLPVPDVNIEEFTLTLTCGETSFTYTLDELKSQFEPVEIPVTIQCAGNRRSEFNQQVKDKKVNGLGWGQCAISTARWRGVRVSDLLESHGIDFNAAQKEGFIHLQAEGLDKGPDGVGTGSSIPLARACSRDQCVLLAYEMNGEPIPRDHGYPLRFVVPGTVGARQIKWVTKLSLSHEESHSATQRRDYKIFGPNITDPKTIPWEMSPSVQYLPVTSGILDPPSGVTVETGESVTLSGYAYSGGGNGIVRVDVSFDGGQTWRQAEIYNENDAADQRSWAWTLWTVDFTPEQAGTYEVCVRAQDCNCNTQPERPQALWNVRGLCNNSWHRIQLNVVESDEE